LTFRNPTRYHQNTHTHHERRQHVLPIRLLGAPQPPTTTSNALLTNPQVASQTLRPRRNPLLSPRFAALQKSFLSTEVRSAIDKAVASAPVVLFMKGTPETPQCGFSRAAIQILGLQGVNPQKFTAFNVLEDEELRAGMLRNYHKKAMRCGAGSICRLYSIWLTEGQQESRSTAIGKLFPSCTSATSLLVALIS
jgi:hypothetical protein